MNLFHTDRYGGGFCYAACQDLFVFYNPSTNHCRKGCDFGMGRVNDSEGRYNHIINVKSKPNIDTINNV